MTRVLMFLVIIALGVQARADPPEALDHTKFIEASNCLKKENLIFADVLEFALEDKLELAEKNPKLKCFASCLLEYGKLIDGCTILSKNSDTVKDKQMEKFVKLVDSCKDVVKGSDRCECGFQLIKCITEKGKEK
ncbi:general odorant-binding protein 56d-like [Eupeodes corollae]|uniref:general odorant-binding protein 56d-like n=1 Tax=Eupeodes corollae TaxID=290404 RepID=UPI0024909133|nr:general odorant-binding protein 56d-like [Eupeodes corollae]